MNEEKSTLFTRLESEISNYLTGTVEISPGVKFSQSKLINRIYRFRNRDLSGVKVDSDLRYIYYYDIISPRVDNTVKNLRFDSKNVMVFSQNPIKDFAAVFISNASLKSWMAGKGEDLKLKTAVEEFAANGNVIFKKVSGGYEFVDPRNAYVTNQQAESIEETAIIERHEMTASDLLGMKEWDQDEIEEVIKELGNKSFKSTSETTPTSTTGKKYEIFEYTGEVNELEFNQAKKKPGGDENKYFLAKVIVAGLKSDGKGTKHTLFAEKLTGTMGDHYISAHFGKYDGRFWRVGIYEMLFDHQIRANEIGNQLARGLEWASKAIFRSKDKAVMSNMRADLDNGDIINTEDLGQVEVRMQGLDQLIADWNRLIADADKLTNSYEVVRGEALPSGTPFRMGLMLDQNAGKLFLLLRQKITLPYKRVFREWVLPYLIKDMKGEEIFRFTGDNDILDQFREIIVDSWYIKNLVAIGPHTKETADAIKQEKMDEMKKQDPAIKNAKEIWDSVISRLFITITGENYELGEQIQDVMQLIPLEMDAERRDWILDMVYKARGIPVPPKKPQQPMMNNQLPVNQGGPQPMNGQQPEQQPAPANA